MRTEKLSLIVRPNSSRNCIDGWQMDRLKIRLKAFPEKGRANKELVNFIAGELNISRRNIRIISGKKSIYKELLIDTSEDPGIFSMLPLK